MRKSIIFMIIIAVVLILVFINAYSRNDFHTVLKLPEKFVHLEKGGYWGDNLRYVVWETQISFLDTSGITIYQTSITNRDFIVRYKGEIYINEEKYLDMIDIVYTVHD